MVSGIQMRGLFECSSNCGETGSSWGSVRAFWAPHSGEIGRTPGALGLDTMDDCMGASYREAGCFLSYLSLSDCIYY